MPAPLTLLDYHRLCLWRAWALKSANGWLSVYRNSVSVDNPNSFSIKVKANLEKKAAS